MTKLERKCRAAVADSRQRILRTARRQRIAAKHVALSDAFIYA
ncbi:hypothetical protein [Ancylobacter amanitiformis]|uniref:Uncharacterized protein n=1 Tax=Ancylobacter amanitiformis TaxID=217069 RepID=A0ABU0LQH5_9HYPH|nr:hypothetical protein [Ancylobacter amanitiformis]MDQ0510900.1 hypothetical protein [Ancylobacter amanitiformis]